MPFGIQRSDNKWKVVNKHTGRVLGTHDDEEAAKKQLAAVQINYNKESVQEGYGIESNKSGFSEDESAKPSSEDLKKVQDVLNNKEMPDVAEDGKAYVVRWAGGRGVFACKNKKYLSKWLNDTGSWAEIISIQYKEPVQDGKKLKLVKEDVMNLNESNELIMSLAHKHKIKVSVLEQLWTEAISKQEENAKTREEKDKASPKFWKGVRSNFRSLIDTLDIQEAKAIMDSRENYTNSTSQWIDHLQSGDYAAAEKVFPDVIKSKLDIMINDGKEKYLKQMSDKVNKNKE